MFQVTDEWLRIWRTSKGGYTRKQLAAIGVAWPPPKHWKTQAYQKVISDEAVRQFQEGARLR